MTPQVIWEFRGLLVQSAFYAPDGAVNVLKGSCLQAVNSAIIFLQVDLPTCFPQIVQCGMKAARLPGHCGYRRMVIEVLAVPYRRLFDLIDGCVDPIDSLLLIQRLSPVTGTMFDHPAGGAQIG